MGLLDGKVVIITGAGNGIGRTHALMFAAEGAKVCVNDLGGARDGTGGGTRAADAVVEEIRAAGGEAVASYDSVADADGARNLVKVTLDAFGRVDVLVNNAGILRDKTLHKMDDAMFDLVVAVHLRGTWLCTKVATAAMVEAGHGGVVINTTSIAGLKGNFGQTNYSAAKAGIWGFTQSAAIELKRFGIRVNAIAPMAKTRMTDDIDVVPKEMTPEQISRVALWLASDLAADVTGKTYGVHGQQVFAYRMELTDGVEREEPWTPDALQAALADIEALDSEKAPAPFAAPKAVTDRDIVRMLVEGAPEYLREDKAAGIRSVFHLQFKDADPFTIDVKDGACAIHDGHVGEKTCKITTDAKTYIGLAKGTVNAQSAFMGGKLAADNLGEAMRYATLFRQPDPKDVDAKIEALKGAAGAASPAPAKPREVTEADVVDLIVKAAPEHFRKEKASGVNSVFHLHVKGARPYTLTVADGECAVADGHVGTATCNVKTDAKTYIGIAKGTVNAQSAFMGGKLAADNLGEAMRYATLFRQPDPATIAAQIEALRGPAPTEAASAPAAAPGPAAPAAPTPKELCAEAFARLAEVFEPAKAGGWEAAIVWRIDGGGDYTVRIADSACDTDPSAAEDATATVRTSAEVFLDIIRGELKADKAFMLGKVTADNLGDMMRFTQCFDMKQAAVLFREAEAARKAAAAEAMTAEGGAAASAPATAAPAPKPAAAGLNKDLIGKRYSGGAHFARPADMKAYALATSDPNPRYTGEDGSQVAPPIFPVRLMKEALFKVVGDPALNGDPMRMVHGEQDLRFYRPIRPWDLVTVRARIDAIEEKSSGQVLQITAPCYVEGELCCEGRWGLFFKNKQRAPGEKKAAAPPADEARGDAAFADEVVVAADQPKRYSAASLDDNPIHLDDAIAKAAGLPGVILHGLCTMAFASRAVVQGPCGGDPDRLKRIAVRFSKPVLPGQTLTTSGWTLEGATDGVAGFGFETQTAEGVAVIQNGRCEVATA